MDTDGDGYDELYAWTLTRGREAFALQHVVDAQGAQTATESSKPVRVVFSLVGLYLHLERGYTGVQVQRAHMQLGKQARDWPRLPLPRERGAMTPRDVLAVAAGDERDRAITRWCESVWAAWQGSRDTIVALLAQHGIR